MVMSWKRATFISCSIIILAIILFMGIPAYRNIMRQRKLEVEMELERERQRDISETYLRLNYSFLMALDPDIDGELAIEGGGMFKPLYETLSSQNPFGISTRRYVLLLMYYHQTGNILEYEVVVEYFSQELEPDGTLRLYNNGNHPEFETFVAWMWDGRRNQEARRFFDQVLVAYTDYHLAHSSEGFARQHLSTLSPQFLSALARSVVDPDYILDLTSLQQQGY